MQLRVLVMHDEVLRKEFGARLKVLRKQKNWARKNWRPRWTYVSSSSTSTRADLTFRLPRC